MQAYFLAGLVSLSLVAYGGSAALAQAPLWFSPQALDSGPSAAADSKAPTISQRFGGLFSKPGTRLAIAMGNEQADIVTAGGVGETPSPQPLGVPWAARDRKHFSFAEFDSSDSKSSDVHRTRGAQVSPLAPQIAPQIAQPLRARAESTAGDMPASNNVPWSASSIAADRPSSNWPLLDAAQRARPLPRLDRIESVEHQASRPLQARLTSSARPLGNSNEELSLVLPVPADKLEFATKVRPSRVAMVPQQSTGGLPSSANAHVSDVAEPARAEPPALDRITDMTTKHVESSQAGSGNDKPSSWPVRGSMSDQTPLLKTDSMIGPLKGAEQLFGRLQLADDLRAVAVPARLGPREDISQYGWMPTPYTWVSPAFYHYPLYFEQPNLERYGVGRARVVQPLLSSAHFFWSIPLVPYKTLTHHPRERVYTLGQGRPGNCLPVQRGVILGPSTVGEVSMFWEQCSGY